MDRHDFQPTRIDKPSRWFLSLCLFRKTQPANWVGSERACGKGLRGLMRTTGDADRQILRRKLGGGREAEK